MSKVKQRKPAPKAAPAGDVHTRIAAEAKAAKANPAGPRDAAETPALQALADSAAAAVTGAIPSRFEHEGRTYYLRVSPGLMRFAIFETYAATAPMAQTLFGTLEEFGHRPHH